ncbi:MAG: bis(5'-nucleosyl)-tetraphosphatase (symmetrical) YqeK [Lachnospiraceae bacterium]|nr:bis(5'-nucleosyl)-tetraphosphatase (symmetrical) YqeK [Lachnospiraceae bacterium]
MGREEKLEKELKKELDDDRYAHTLGVAYTAACLAMRYGEKPERAFLAGLLHDCAKAKNMDHKKMLSLCEKHKIPVTQFEQENPVLLHAKLGSFLAKEKYEVIDEEILSAIRWHTTGHAGMTLLEKIIYIADYIEPNRKKQPHLDEVREICFQNLDDGLRRILHDTLFYLNNKKSIDPATQQTYDYYMKYDSNVQNIQSGECSRNDT